MPSVQSGCYFFHWEKETLAAEAASGQSCKQFSPLNRLDRLKWKTSLGKLTYKVGPDCLQYKNLNLQRVELEVTLTTRSSYQQVMYKLAGSTVLQHYISSADSFRSAKGVPSQSVLSILMVVTLEDALSKKDSCVLYNDP